MKCYICEKGVLQRKKSEFKLYGESLGKFDSEVCGKCGQIFFDENASNAIDKVAKEKGLWGLDAKTKVAKAGDSLIIRINKRLAHFINLKKGKEVIIHPENSHKITIETSD